MALDYTIADQVFNGLDQIGQSYSLVFATGRGLTFVMEAIGLAFAWEMIFVFLMMLSGNGVGALKRFVDTVVFIAIVGGLIYGWGSIVVPIPMAMADELVAIVSAGQSSAGLASGMSLQFWEAINHVADTILPSQQPVAAATATGGSQTLWEQMGQWWDSSPVSSVFVGIADGIVGSVMSIGVVILLVTCFAVTFMSLITVNVLIYLGLILGPLLLAFAVVSDLRHLVGNWISFMLGAIFLKPVLAVLIAMSMSILQLINTVASTNPSAQTPQALIMLFTAMLTACILLLIKSGPSITAALFGGIGGKLAEMPATIKNISKDISTVKPSSPPPPK